MRILYVSDVYFPRVNGVSTSIQTFRRELARLGHDCVLIAPEYPAHYPVEAGVVRVPARYLPFDPEDRAMRLADLRRAERAVAGGGFDLVHIQTPFLAHYSGLRLARRLGVPCVATYHTLFEEYLYHYVPLLPRAWLRSLARGFSRAQCNALDAVVVPSTAMRETLARYGVTVPTEIVPTGIALPDFARGDGARFRAERGIEAGRPVLLYVGRVAFEKNIGFLLRTFARVRADFPAALLVICGEGPAVKPLQREAQALGVASSVLFAGYLDRASTLLDCYRAADAFVFASRTETQGLVLLEAMALGVPIVSTAVMGTRDIVGPGRGAVVAREDEDDFAACVVTLLGTPALRERLAREARTCAEGWSAAAMAERMQALYQGVIERAAGARVSRAAAPALRARRGRGASVRAGPRRRQGPRPR